MENLWISNITKKANYRSINTKVIDNILNSLYLYKQPIYNHIISYSRLVYHIISYYIKSYHIILYHIISYYIILYHIISNHVILYHIMYCHIISYHVIILNLIYTLMVCELLSHCYMWIISCRHWYPERFPNKVTINVTSGHRW